MENQHQAGVLQAPELRVDDTSADDDDRVPLADAARGLGCTVLDLLGLAAGGTIKLFVALRPYAWTLTATLGAEPRRQATGNTAGGQFELLPQYAEQLRNFGIATIRHIPAPNLPDMHFITLAEEQVVGLEHVWIARRHVLPSADAPRTGGPAQERTGRARALSEAQQAEVRAAYEQGETESALARRFGVSRKTIGKYRAAPKTVGAASWIPTGRVHKSR